MVAQEKVARLHLRCLNLLCRNAAWKGPEISNAALSYRLGDFSKDIHPIPCHSHNDYDRRVPPFDALHHGCIGVETDVWLLAEDEPRSSANDSLSEAEPLLLVGHAKKTLKPSRTLKSLYIDPLVEILQHQNSIQNSPDDSTLFSRGIYDATPDATVVLLIDFKTDPEKLWTVVSKQLDPLRKRGWLTHWTSDIYNTSASSPRDRETGDGTLHIRPLTIVATGSVLFNSVTTNETYRDIFFDAPLEDLASDTRFTVSNSWYASAPLTRAVGKTTIFMNHFKKGQIETIRQQTDAAREKGLISRYWNTSTGPSKRRHWVWEGLLWNGADMLNVDHLKDAYGLFTTIMW